MIFDRRNFAATSFVVAAAIFAMAGETQAQTPLFEVEASDTTKLLRVNSDGGFVVFGNIAGQIPLQGQGARFMWHPGKAAVRGGRVTGGQWDDGVIGSSSVAFGRDTRASASYSVAFGNETQALGFGALVVRSGNWTGCPLANQSRYSPSNHQRGAAP